MTTEDTPIDLGDSQETDLKKIIIMVKIEAAAARYPGFWSLI